MKANSHNWDQKYKDIQRMKIKFLQNYVINMSFIRASGKYRMTIINASNILVISWEAGPIIR